MNFESTLIRCSALGNIMTEPKLKADKEAGNLSETAKSYLVDVYVSEMYRRHPDVSSKYISKGLMVEEDSITLYSRVKKTFFKKNELILTNEFIKGTPDLYIGESIDNAKCIIDIKSSWDIFTFHRTTTKAINNMYWWQLQGYMYLTNAKSSVLAYCLVDTPEVLINDEKRKLMYKMNAATEESPDYVQACMQLDLLMRYDDIPMKNKVIEFHIERDEEAIKSIGAKVIKAREYLRNLSDWYANPLNTITE